MAGAGLVSPVLSSLQPKDEIRTSRPSRNQKIGDGERKRDGRGCAALAFDPKEKEHHEFCKAIYPNEAFNKVITAEKLCQFFFYTTFCEQCKKGGKHNKAPKPKFDADIYKKLMKFFWADSTELAMLALPCPKKPVGICAFDQC